MGLKERIIQFIDYKGLSIQRFELYVGLSNASVAKMGNNTRRTTIDKISIRFPELNINWLLTGEGEMIKSESSSALITHTGTFKRSTINSTVNNGDVNGNVINNSDINEKYEKKSQVEKENMKLKEENRLFKLQIELQNKSLEDKERIINEKERLIQALIKK